MKEKDILVLLGIILGVFVIKYLIVATQKLQGTASTNKESWRVVRDNTGRLVEIEISRNVRGN